jgi:RimJ/RimL family protein N-acetyltransferase
MTTEFLTGISVYLRPIESADLTEKYRDWFNDPEVCQFNSHHRFPNYNEDMKAYYESTIRSHDNLVLAICDKATKAHIGNVSLQNIDTLNQSAEFAIVVGDKGYWGKGVGREAMHLIIAHGFNELNLQRIYLGTSEKNIAMQKLALGLGFKEEGRARHELYKNGTFVDGLKYGLLRDEFKSVTS